MSDFKFRFPAVAITAFVALTAVATIPVAAQTPATSTMRLSLDDVVRLALTNGTQPALARSSQVRATTSAAEARAALLPEAQAKLMRYSQSINLATFGFSLPGFPQVVGPFNVTDAQITAALDLFDLAALKRYDAARHGESASKHQVEQTENDVAAAAARLFILVQRAEANVKAGESNVSLFGELSRIAHDQFDAGTGTRLDTSRAEAQLARERQLLLVAQNQREGARLALLHAIGADQSVDVELVTSAPHADAPPPVSEALATALAQRPEMAQAEERLKAARLEVEAAREARLPTLGIDFLGDMSGNHADDLRWSRRIGAGVTVPIFSGGRISAHVAEAIANLHDVEAESTEAKREIEEEVRRSVLDISSATARIDVAKQNVSVAEEELSVSRDRVANGVGSQIEIDRAQDSYRQSREDQIAAESDAALAQIELEHATGAIRRRVGAAAATAGSGAAAAGGAVPANGSAVMTASPDTTRPNGTLTPTPTTMPQPNPPSSSNPTPAPTPAPEPNPPAPNPPGVQQ